MLLFLHVKMVQIYFLPMLFYTRIVAKEVDAMVTGRMTPIILLADRLLSSRGFAGRRNAQRALDGNSFMCGANPHLSKEK